MKSAQPHRIQFIKKLFFASILSIFLTPLFAAQNISGTVIDSAQNQALEFVNIAVFQQGSERMLIGTITDENGRFSFSNIASGAYSLQVSFIGYHTFTRDFVVENQDLNLGTIRLSQDTELLTEVEVRGMGSQMRFEVDRRVFSVDQAIAAAGGSITEVLENIPSVEVDQEGNISLRGNENVEVWINGRPSGLTAENRAQILQQMPAESIESIELITNPSARFDAEGTAGIINLIMRRDRRAGYFGNVSTGLMYVSPGRFGESGRLGGNLGANINYNSSRLDAHLNIGYRNMARQGGSLSELITWNAADSVRLLQTNRNSGGFDGVFFRAGVDYRLNARNSIGISGFGTTGGGGGETRIDNLQQSLISGDTLRHFRRNNFSEMNRLSLNVRLDYRHDFRPGSDLRFSMVYSRNNLGQDNRYLQTAFSPSLETATTEIRQRGGGNDNRVQFRLDYTNRMTETSRLEAGFHSTVLNRSGNAHGFNFIPAIEQEIEIFGYFNEFDYREQIHAAYITYGDRFFDRLSAQVGLRGEYLWRDLDSRNKNATGEIQPVPFVFENEFFQLFPSLFLSYSISEHNDIQFNYTRRISRPRGMQINPFTDFSDSLNVSFGNPALIPEFSSAFELNYLRQWGNHSFSTSVFYRFTDNVIQRISYLNPVEGYMANTFMNLSQSRSTGVELVMRNRLFQMMQLTSSLNLFHSQIESGVFVNPFDNSITEVIDGRESFSWSARVVANMMFSRTLSAQITGQYRSPREIAQGTQESEYSIDLGLRKSFFNRSLNVSANVRDLLNSRGRVSTTSGDGFWRHTDAQWHGRMIGINVSYNFGNMQPPRRNQNRERENDHDMDDMDTLF